VGTPEIAGPVQVPENAARAVLRQLPQWFGIESALLEYARQAELLSNFMATVDGALVGFLTMREHNPATLEISCIAVAPALHGQGVGSRLCEAAETWWSARGGKLMQVKTLGATHPSANYARTRRFYEARGFLPVEEFADLWPGIPCLLLVKPLSGTSP
jgi:GNAT superfamily N-acetyltransferase